MLPLRPYQHDLLHRVQDALAEKPKARLMLQLPTGGGKTVIAGSLLADWLQDGRKAVWLTHRKELAEQTQRMLTDAGVSAIINVNWASDGAALAMSGGAIILMAQTVGLRATSHEVWNRYDADDLLVIDEAHHATAPGWERAMRQWPGPIVGMTATPWRLSKKEGFDHLFCELLCGPQTADLQALEPQPALCRAQVLIPSQEQRIVGGAIDRTGDYTEAGITQANSDRPNVMTAGALAFWQKHAEGRQTIAYAVSVNHANNLAAVFKDAGVSADVILGESNQKRTERDAAIAGFRKGDIKVLVNVLVATEGFDLPDASCIIIARPTMSLALYLQMVGRGLRPKPEGADYTDCLIMDLAANVETHGLPEDYRDWSLEPRGTQPGGEAPVVICPRPKCEAASPASSHYCRVCGYSFGKDCDRCGRWRSHRRWQYETHCGDQHQQVCDLCHIDAHIRSHLPIASPLDQLVEMYVSEDEIMFPNDAFENDDLTKKLCALFRELLEAERRSVLGPDYENRSVDKQAVFDSASIKARYILKYAGRDTDLLPVPDISVQDPISPRRTVKESAIYWLSYVVKEHNGETVGLPYTEVRDKILEEHPSSKIERGLISHYATQIRKRAKGYEHGTLPDKRPRSSWTESYHPINSEGPSQDGQDTDWDGNTTDSHRMLPLDRPEKDMEIYLLLSAAGRGDKVAVQNLLAAGADPNAEDIYHETPLESASSGGHTEAVRVLLVAGADPNAKNHEGIPPLE